MRTILITGGSGAIAKVLRGGLRQQYALRLTDIVPVADLAKDESFMPADLTELDAVMAVMDGVESIIHLGGFPKEDCWEKILPANIIGTYNVFEAARRRGVKRILYASSGHIVGFYRRHEIISTDVPVRPDGRYGVSKAFGEALGRLYVDKYGLQFFAMRIGAVSELPLDVRRLATWISPRDLVQLVTIGLTLPNLRFEIVYGMSDNKRAWWDNSNALRLGYRPQDCSEDYAEQLLRNEPPRVTDDPAYDLQGGPYATLEVITDPTKPGGR